MDTGGIIYLMTSDQIYNRMRLKSLARNNNRKNNRNSAQKEEFVIN